MREKRDTPLILFESLHVHHPITAWPAATFGRAVICLSRVPDGLGPLVVSAGAAGEMVGRGATAVSGPSG